MTDKRSVYLDHQTTTPVLEEALLGFVHSFGVGEEAPRPEATKSREEISR